MNVLTPAGEVAQRQFGQLLNTKASCLVAHLTTGDSGGNEWPASWFPYLKPSRFAQNLTQIETPPMTPLVTLTSAVRSERTEMAEIRAPKVEF